MHIAATVVIGRDADDVPGARALVATALELVGTSSDDCADLTVAVSEAVTNAVEHAASGEDVVLTIDLTRERAEIVVRDEGRGFVPPESPEMPDPQATAGRGLALMRLLVDEVDVESSPGQGTIVRIRHQLRGLVSAGC